MVLSSELKKYGSMGRCEKFSSLRKYKDVFKFN